MKRNKDGTFKAGVSYSPKTQFKKGQHWRKHKPFWDKEWLHREYITKQRSAKEIANDFNIKDTSIYFWLKKHNIKTRSISEVREVKHWGQKREKNPMFGKIGENAINWRGGITPERQSFYSSLEWKDAIAAVWERDKDICQRCKCVIDRTKRNFGIHHIVSFTVKELRSELNNLALLCSKCHGFIHSKKNINNEFILTYDQYKQKFK